MKPNDAVEEAAVLALILAALLAVAPAMSARAIGTNTVSLSQEIGHKLALLPRYGVFDNLQYRVDGSEVILTGQVISKHEQLKCDAETVVGSIEGVTRVVNNIQVLPMSALDNRIRQNEYWAIFSQSDLSRYKMGAVPRVHIIVDNGGVTLDGTVIDEMDRTIAGIAANSVPGVLSVKNDLRVRS